MPKSLKISDKEQARITELFKDGLTKGNKNPSKYWLQKRKQQDAIKPYKGFKR
jgi:hypothetical protein